MGRALELLDPVDLDRLADRIVDRLGRSVISSVLPAHVGEWIRDAASHGQRWQQNQVYLAGPNCLLTKWILNADGTLQLELDGPDGSRLWQGVFRPAEA